MQRLRFMNVLHATGVALALLVPAGGCAKTPPVDSVTGQVLVDGKALGKGVITFFPKDDPALGSLTGIVRDGRFEIIPQPQRGEGKHGRFGVLIRAAPADTTYVPACYQDRAATPLIVELQTGANHLEPFDLRKQPPAPAREEKP